MPELGRTTIDYRYANAFSRWKKTRPFLPAAAAACWGCLLRPAHPAGSSIRGPSARTEGTRMTRSLLLLLPLGSPGQGEGRLLPPDLRHRRSPAPRCRERCCGSRRRWRWRRSPCLRLRRSLQARADRARPGCEKAGACVSATKEDEACSAAAGRA